MTQAVRSALSNYATFSGRARRSEYWWFYLSTVVIGLVASGIDALLNSVFDNALGVVGSVTSVALLLPSLAVTSRRLHDTGRTGWWMVLPIVPLILAFVVSITAGFLLVVLSFRSDVDAGQLLTWLLVAPLVGLGVLLVAAFIVLLVFLCQDSRPGPNKYGPSPKGPRLPVGGPQGYFPIGPTVS